MLMRGLQMICPLEPPFILDPDTLNTVEQYHHNGPQFVAPGPFPRPLGYPTAGGKILGKIPLEWNVCPPLEKSAVSCTTPEWL